MTSERESEIALHSDGKRLILPSNYDECAIAEISENKARFIADLRRSQMNASGFYTCLPTALRDELRSSPWLTIAIMTTAVTRFSTQFRVSKDTPIGDGTWLDYRATHHGSRLLTKPRIRTLSVSTPPLGYCAWDLDALGDDDRCMLLEVVLDRKVIVVHEAGVAFSWLFGETPARPSTLLDTSLLFQQCKPGALLRPFRMVVAGNPDVQDQMRALIERENGGPSTSLQWIAASLSLPCPDRHFQDHANWCVSPLSVAHRQYAKDILRLPVETIHSLFPGIAVEQTPNEIREKFPWYSAYAEATAHLAEAHVHGVRLDESKAQQLAKDLTDDIIRGADELQQKPELASFHSILTDPHAGETRELREAVSALATAPNSNVGCEGGLSSQETAGPKSGADNVIGLLQLVRRNKAHYNSIQRYRKAASTDGRLHSLITFKASTGRSTSIEPAIQNISKDSRFRSLIRARSGHLILATDYKAAELRIAAGLAERAIASIHRSLDEGRVDSWFMKRVYVGVQATEQLCCPPEPNEFDFGWLEQAIPAIAQRVLGREMQQMASVFAMGLDPHLVTAVDLARRKGPVGNELDPIQWLKSIDQPTRDELKLKLQDDRQKAKPTNFGLLYGMSSEGLFKTGVSEYGLTWSFDEARTARQAWFALYPEFQMWHWWTSMLQSRLIARDRCMLWNSKTKSLARPEYDVKLFETSTLTGRPLAVLGNLKKAINYQAQGTGADILARAISSLPDDIATMLLLPVHDELVFEVPAGKAQQIKQVVEETMVRAATEIVGSGIPIEVDSEIGESWGSSLQPTIASME